MDDEHRKRIEKNMDRIIRMTNFEQLANACVEIGLLTPVMLQNVKRLPDTDKIGKTEEEMQTERHKRLLKKITKRGPDAFQTFCRICADLHYDTVLGILVNNDRYVSIHNNKINIAAATIPPSQEYVDRTNHSTTNNSNNNNEDSRRSSISNADDDDDDENIDGAYQQIDRRRSSTKPLNSINVLEEYTGEIRPKVLHTVRKAKKIHKHPSLDTYPMQTKENRGVFFMVNIINFPEEHHRRDGADEDAHSLLHVFKELGFKLFSYTNLSYDDFFKILDELLKSDYTKNTECFVMALMTHGNMDDGVQRITFTDGSVVKVKDIEEYFNHHVCGNLVNKPKICLFPFCRGDLQERGFYDNKIQTDSITFNTPKMKNIPNLSDFIVCYATSEGFKAHRDPDNGSWYIQNFVMNMAEHAHDTSFEDILKKIQADTLKLRTMEGTLQTASYVNKGFNKALYFNPGVWEK
ncbi:death regulator Nedd2-like caspase isoform X1 [Musca autumnalis]|uniref:death regulator Nedd2-like caspase isoform X1 n=1 Tax=Musca autumnalis TaxID=221902 RepID=UPI003CF33733